MSVKSNKYLRPKRLDGRMILNIGGLAVNVVPTPVDTRTPHHFVDSTGRAYKSRLQLVPLRDRKTKSRV